MPHDHSPARGVLELHPKGYGFLRNAARNFAAQPGDAYVSAQLISKHGLREGLLLAGPVEAARSVLPNATETKIFVTANARALRHFIELRGSRHAETEIRKLAVAVLKIMQTEAPSIFGDYQLVPLPDGTSEAITEHRKV